MKGFKMPNWLSGFGKKWSSTGNIAPDPVRMTRQVRRAKERRAYKMPVGAKQSAWHRANGFTVSRRMEARGRT